MRTRSVHCVGHTSNQKRRSNGACSVNYGKWSAIYIHLQQTLICCTACPQAPSILGCSIDISACSTIVSNINHPAEPLEMILIGMVVVVAERAATGRLCNCQAGRIYVLPLTGQATEERLCYHNTFHSTFPCRVRLVDQHPPICA